MERTELESEIERLHQRSFGWAVACWSWDKEEAEGVLQTAYLKVLDGAGFDGRSSVKTWLFAIIRNTATDRRRRRWMATLGLARWLVSGADTEPANPVDATDQSRTHARGRATLAGLAARQREAPD